MKKIYSLLLIMGMALSLFAQRENQSTKYIDIPGQQMYEYKATGEVSIVKRSEIDRLIKEYVNAKLQEWLQRGETEKVADWQKRTSARNVTNYARRLTQNKMNQFGEENVSLKIIGCEYDTENEVCRLDLASLQPIYIPLPSQYGEAERLIRNYKELRFSRAQYTLTRGTHTDFALMYVEIYNPYNGNKYIYDSDTRLTFMSRNVEAKIEPIDYKNYYKKEVSAPVVGSEAVVEKRVDVDRNIPNGKGSNKNTHAFIIGNEDYSSAVTGRSAAFNVPFAQNDAEIFAEYCKTTLNIPDGNVHLFPNATLTKMLRAINSIKFLEPGSNVIFYYAGHGLPSKPGEPKKSFLIPVDGDGNDLENLAIDISDLYQSLSGKNLDKAVVFLDACFSGAAREKSLLEEKGARRMIITQDISVNKYKGNMVVFSASSSEEEALPIPENEHGLFTFYLLKKLKESKGSVALGPLATYLKEEVSTEAGRLHRQSQKPDVQVTERVRADWKTWTLFEN